MSRPAAQPFHHEYHNDQRYRRQQREKLLILFALSIRCMLSYACCITESQNLTHIFVCFSILYERNSAPYSFSGQDLNSGLASPSTSNVLYPNLNNEASNSSAGLSSLRSDNHPSKYDSGILTSVRTHENLSECGTGVLTSVRSRIRENSSECGTSVLTSVRLHGYPLEYRSAGITSSESTSNVGEKR